MLQPVTNRIIAGNLPGRIEEPFLVFSPANESASLPGTQPIMFHLMGWCNIILAAFNPVPEYSILGLKDPFF